MTRCLRIRDLEIAEDIVNMFGHKTELRSTRFGVKFREISRKKVIISSKESPFPWASAYFATFFKNQGCSAKVFFTKVKWHG